MSYNPLNLAAHTPPTSPYPPYASANLVNGRVELTVRSPAGADGSCGTTSCISMSIEDFGSFVIAAKERLDSALEYLGKVDRP